MWYNVVIMGSKTTPDDKRSHLEFIQGVINRLSSNTFLFKGWSITIIGAVFTTMIATNNNDFLWLILGIVLMFWVIDAYYLKEVIVGYTSRSRKQALKKSIME